MDRVEKMDCRTNGEVILGASRLLQPNSWEIALSTPNQFPVGKLMRKGKNMLNEQTFDKLYTMKLTGMAEGFKEQLEQPPFRDLSFEERFGILVDRQWTWKENKRLKRLLRDAKLKLQASPEDIDFRTPRGIEKSVILSLTSCQWIRSHQNLLISGPTGVGKTFLAWPLLREPARKTSEPSTSGSLSYSIRSPWTEPREVTEP